MSLPEIGASRRIETPDGGSAWLVTRYDEVRAALADPLLSLDKRNSTTGYRGLTLPPALDANLLNMDPPDHGRIRRLVSGVFTVRRVEGMRDRVRDVAEELLDAMEGRDEVDLVASFATPFPIAVICELLGVPEDRRADFRSWTNSILNPRKPEDAKEAIGRLTRVLTDLTAAKRREPGDDLTSAMVAARDGDGRLSEDELTSLAFLILFAGFENTAHLIGNAVAELLCAPEQAAKLRGDDGLLETAVEELLRHSPPAPLAIRRFALEDLDIGGVRIPAGHTVLLSLAAANRDPGRHADPHTLDFARADNGHLGFGHGIHFCLGAALARMEIEIALAGLLRRFPDATLATSPDRLRRIPSPRTNGFLALPVRLSASRPVI
ncbi:MAG: cytochrome P450 family protein [Stackebrandtia sp.]